MFHLSPARLRVSFFLAAGPLAALAVSPRLAFAQALPAPQNGDIGAVVHKGGVEANGGVFKINGSGTDLWDTSDSFHFVYWPLEGDGTLVAHFTGGLQYVDSWAKGGLVMRNGLGAGAANAAMLVTSQNGAVFQQRGADGGGTGTNALAGNYSSAAGGKGAWLKLEREGDTISGFLSEDGTVWARVGSGKFQMAPAIQVGLAMTPHDPNQAFGYATFSDVRITKGKPQAAKADTRPMTARRAWEWTDSVGVALHLPYRDTPNGDFSGIVFPRLKELGVKHIRDSLNDAEFPLVKRLHDELGIKITMVVGNQYGGMPIPQIVETVKKAGPIVEAVEGINEPDIPMWNDKTKNWDFWFTFDGQTNSDHDLPATRAHQKAMFDALKADLATKKVQVLSAAMAFPENAVKAGAIAADMAAAHPYTGGAPITKDWWARWQNGMNTLVPGKPMYITEAGYHNALSGAQSQPGVSEVAAAKYIPRMLFDYFNRGVKRTTIYEFINLHPNPNGDKQEENWGLLRADGVPKPAFLAVKNLLSLLQDDAAPFVPQPLALALEGDTGGIGTTLLQKRDGKYDLILWQNAESFDRQNKLDLNVPDRRLNLAFARPMKRIQIFRFLPNNATTSVEEQKDTPSVTLAVPDWPLVIEISP